MPQLSRERLIMAKIEGTYNTDSVPAAANAIIVSNLEIVPIEQEVASRELVKPFLGDVEQAIGKNSVSISFDCELVGSGTAGTAPGFGALLRACGLSETVVASTSVTYAPVSSGWESVSIYTNVGGILHKVTGARGTFNFEMSAGQFPKIKFKFVGNMGTVTDTAFATPTYTNFATPLPMNNTNTTAFALHGYSGVMSSLSFDMGQDLVHRSLAGGSEYAQITSRDVTGSITMEMPTIAAKDWFTAAKSATAGALTVLHGTIAGNKCTISGPKVQVTKPVYQDENGIQMLQLALNFRPNAAGGNDEISLAFT